MVALQILNKILQDKDFSIVSNNGLTREHFAAYENEFEFIRNHVEKYKQVPDKATFVSNFPNFEFTEVAESDKYLVDKIREEYLYNASLVPILNKAAELCGQDSNVALEYIKQQISNIQTTYDIEDVDIIHEADKRVEELNDKHKNKDNWFFSSGFPELDKLTGGLQRGEELIVLFARTNQGKSWIAEKIAVSVWEQGYNVGFFSPEMTANSIGYRFDTLFKNFSNSDLVWGNKVGNDYIEYTKKLATNKAKFLITTPKNFDHKTTISKLRNWIQKRELQLLVVDGLTYIQDERYRRGDNTTTTLTNISEDLMSLSIELKIPIIAVVQANREAAGDDKMSAPALETIRNSDGISFNASKVISLRNKEGMLELNILKQRNGIVGNKLFYSWNIDTGKFEYIPNPKSGLSETSAKPKEAYDSTASVF